eukprot:scaffold40992_cov33-Tisochrysis_lutea.AAC.6
MQGQGSSRQSLARVVFRRVRRASRAKSRAKRSSRHALSEQLAQYVLNLVAARVLVRVVTVRGDNGIIERHRRLDTHADGLLAVIEMAEAGDELALVQHIRRNLHAAHGIPAAVRGQRLSCAAEGARTHSRARTSSHSSQ